MRLDNIIKLAKNRGFIIQSSEPYGGFSSTYDYGPLGVEIKNNIKKAWWRQMVYKSNNIFGLDSAILMNPKIWEASGHLGAGFTDPLVECKNCHLRYRKDHISQDNCPNCKGELTDEKKFNLMMKTFIGPAEDTASVAYLRPETAQGMYINAMWVRDTMRAKIPFGVAQIGKAFRNEITPRHFTYRTREFEQMEMQFFIHEKDSDKWFEYWKKERMNWYTGFGINKDNLKFHEHKDDELAHYAKAAVDIQYKFPEPMGWQELEGIHNRGNWDLSRHSEFSGKELSHHDEATNETYIPSVIEVSAGADRTTLVFLIDAYEQISGGRSTTTESTKESETVLRIQNSIAPVKACVLPLVKNKEEVISIADEVYESLRKNVQGLILYDKSGSIGRRYRRQDEIGTPYCITIDFESKDDNSVTVRHRDTMEQERILISKLSVWINNKINNQ